MSIDAENLRLYHENILSDEPNNAEALTFLATWYMERHLFTKAGKFFKHLVTIITDDAELFLCSSVCYAMLEEFQSAESFLKIARTLLSVNENNDDKPCNENEAGSSSHSNRDSNSSGGSSSSNSSSSSDSSSIDNSNSSNSGANSSGNGSNNRNSTGDEPGADDSSSSEQVPKKTRTEDVRIMFCQALIFEKRREFTKAFEAYKFVKVSCAAIIGPASKSKASQNTIQFFTELNGEVTLRLAVLKREMGALEESMSLCENILREPYGLALKGNAFCLQGLLYESRNAFPQAESSYRNGLQLCQSHFIALERLGRVYLRYKEAVPVAVQCFFKCLELDPENAIAWYLLGRCYMVTSQFSDACEAYNRAVNLEPNYAHVWCSLGVLYYSFGQYREALGMLRRALQIDSKMTDAWYNIGALYDICEQPQDAQQAYMKANEFGMVDRLARSGPPRHNAITSQPLVPPHHSNHQYQPQPPLLSQQMHGVHAGMGQVPQFNNIKLGGMLNGHASRNLGAGSFIGPGGGQGMLPGRSQGINLGLNPGMNQGINPGVQQVGGAAGQVGAGGSQDMSHRSGAGASPGMLPGISQGINPGMASERLPGMNPGIILGMSQGMSQGMNQGMNPGPTQRMGLSIGQGMGQGNKKEMNQCMYQRNQDIDQGRDSSLRNGEGQEFTNPLIH